MPIYEYRCTECEHRLEKLQRMADDPLKDCPECNQPSLKKLVSAAAFKLKGSGWYETDFKNKEKSTSESNKSDTSSASISDKKSGEASTNKTNSKKEKSSQGSASTAKSSKG